jgi:hypothetical protein
MSDGGYAASKGGYNAQDDLSVSSYTLFTVTIIHVETGKTCIVGLQSQLKIQSDLKEQNKLKLSSMMIKHFIDQNCNLSHNYYW